MAWQAILGAAASALGSGAEGWGEASWQADKAAAASSKAWRRAMFASNTEMTRRVQDLKNAGLNPVLAVGGGGASSPSPGASMVPSVDADIASGITRGITSGKEAALMDAQVGSAKSLEKINEANEVAARNAANASKYLEQRAQFDTDSAYQDFRNRVLNEENLKAQAASTNATTQRINAEAARTRAETVETQARANFIKEYPALYFAEQAGRAAAPVLDAAGKVVGGARGMRRGKERIVEDINPNSGEVYRQRSTRYE